MKRGKRLLRIVLIAVALVAAVLAVDWYFSPDEDLTPVESAAAAQKLDLDRLIAFGQRCNDSYHDHATFKREYGEHVEAGEFPVTGLRIYIDAPPGDGPQWVILRGTANLANVLEDMEFVGRDEHELGIQVHAGFDKSLKECLGWVLERLDPARPVWVTGHSLGGSVAELLMASLELRGFRDVSGITFGQPKFTDAQGVERLNRLKLLRVVHVEDPIPMLPPLIMELEEFGAYHHSGPEVLIGEDGTFAYCMKHVADRFNVRSWWTDLKKVHPLKHDMTLGYLPALKLAKERKQSKDGAKP